MIQKSPRSEETKMFMHGLSIVYVLLSFFHLLGNILHQCQPIHIPFMSQRTLLEGPVFRQTTSVPHLHLFSNNPTEVVKLEEVDLHNSWGKDNGMGLVEGNC